MAKRKTETSKGGKGGTGQHAQKRPKRAERPSKRRRKPKQAEVADRHELYEKAVQSPEMDVEFFDATYQKLRGTKAMVMREDFCGTANLSAEWCRSDPKRRAIGVDFDPEVLAWGRGRNLDAEPALAKRVTLIEGNVLDHHGPKADITCAMNFSYCVFKTRDELRSYFEMARKGLEKDGIFVCELYGGTEAVVELEDVDEKDGFTYHWDQEKFDPITHRTLCHIHFSFADGSKLENAFTYDWRLWTIPELRELLLEAGFSKVRVYWEEMEEDEEDEDEDDDEDFDEEEDEEDEDEDDEEDEEDEDDEDEDDDEDEELEGTGEFTEVEEAENQEAWLCYIVAER